MFINPPLIRKTNVYGGSPGGTVVKSPPASAGDARDVGSAPGRADPPEKGRQPTPCSRLGSPVDRGARQATVRGSQKSRTQLERLGSV